MSKLPRIYHSDEKRISNNKNSYVSYRSINNDEKETTFDFDENIYSLFNKKSSFILKNGNTLEGVIISKRDKELLLNDGRRININDISSIN